MYVIGQYKPMRRHLDIVEKRQSIKYWVSNFSHFEEGGEVRDIRNTLVFINFFKFLSQLVLVNI